MKLLIHLIVFSILFCGIIPSANAIDKNHNDGVTHILSGGASVPTSDYREYLNNGFNLNYNALYKFPILSGNTYLNGGISYYSFKLDGAEDTSLRQADLNAGLLISYPFRSFFEPFAGISGHAIYSNLTAENTNRTEHALKPGCSISAGSLMYIGNGIGFYFNTEYMVTSLSEKTLAPLSITGGLTYNYSNARETSDGASAKILLYEKGMDRFRKKDITGAKEVFIKLRELDEDYPGLDYHVKRIAEIEKNRDTAESLMSRRNPVRAIPYLELCSPYFNECQKELFKVRKKFSPYVNQWLKSGIKSYEKKNYNKCIRTMHKILLVDPLNKNANIYLPRARKRQRAIETLQGN